MKKWVTALMLLSLGVGIGATRRSGAETSPSDDSEERIAGKLGLAGMVAACPSGEAMRLMIRSLAWRKLKPDLEPVQDTARSAGLAFFSRKTGMASFAFVPLSEFEAAAVAVTEDERMAYNAELVRVNGIRGEVVRHTVLEMSTGRILTPSEVGAFAREAWSQSLLTLSTPARSALEKIAKNMARELASASPRAESN